MPLRASDRDALLKVSKGRFEILNIEFSKRMSQLREQVKSEVAAENKEKIEAASADTEAIRVKQRELEDEKRVVVRRHLDQGIDIGQYAFMEGKSSQYISVVNEYKLVEERVEAIRLSAEMNSGRSLREIELRVNEGIITAGFDDDSDAKAVLAEIPEIDQILPLTAAPRAELASG